VTRRLSVKPTSGIHSVASRGPSLLILALSITDMGAKIPIWSSICLFIYHNCLMMLLPARAFEAEKFLVFAASILRNKVIQNRVFDAIITIYSNIRPKYPLFRRPFALTARRMESSSFAPPTGLSTYRNMVVSKRCKGQI
jgi:hypothetical protein